MPRKLFSVLLCAFALLLLMGAASPEQAALLAEEESIVLANVSLETEAKLHTNTMTGAVLAVTGIDPLDISDNVDETVLVDGAPVSKETNKHDRDGVTYVSLAAMARELEPAAEIGWDGSTMTVTTEKLSLSAVVGQLYLQANGRYLYLPEKVQQDGNGQVIVPMSAVAEAFDAAVSYDEATGLTLVTRGSGAIQSGDSYYDQENLFWLSRVIYAESGNQSLEGMMAVGNVVMNRVGNPVFAPTIQGVLAQKNQFSTYKGGALAKRTPTQASIIAAKLVLDGGVVEETEGALYFDSCTTSWASKNRPFIIKLGGHKFYG